MRKGADGEKCFENVCSRVAERINDAPVLKDYIKSKVSDHEPPGELFFFNSAHLDR